MRVFATDDDDAAPGDQGKDVWKSKKNPRLKNRGFDWLRGSTSCR